MTPLPASAAGRALQGAAPASILEPRTVHPYIGIVGVLIGAVLGTLGSRVTTFGLADLRGGLGLGFDEGAWITTSFGVGQMVMGVAAPYLGAILGVRRVLIYGILVFFLMSLLGPLSPNLDAFLMAQFLAGLGSGSFIPLCISFVLRNLPARLIIYGLAVYSMNSEFSQNIAASLEGWYTEYWSWHWIDWQYCLVLPVMLGCVWFGMPREELRFDLLKQLDWPGLVFAGLGFALLYAGLDQGNRLNWAANGLVVGLLLAGALLTLCFVLRELRIDKPFLNLKLLLRGNLALLMGLLAGFRFIILSTAYIIPTYLQTLQNYRELNVGSVLMWIALPQFLIVLPLGALLKRVDARLVLGAGAIAIGVACLMATRLTSQWATDDFLQSQVLQALGQSFALTALVVLICRSINPVDALSIGCLLQVSRLFGGEIGTAFMQTFVRVREQIHSNLVGQHVDALGALTADRLAMYRAALAAHLPDARLAAGGAAKMLGAAVTQQASVLAYIDGFLAAAVGAVVCLVLLALMQKTPPAPF